MPTGGGGSMASDGTLTRGMSEPMKRMYGRLVAKGSHPAEARKHVMNMGEAFAARAEGPAEYMPMPGGITLPRAG